MGTTKRSRTVYDHIITEGAIDWRAPSGENLSVRLGDAVGTNVFEWLNSAGTQVAYVDSLGGASFSGGSFFADDVYLKFGNTSASPDVGIAWNTAQTVDAFYLGLSAAQNTFIIGEYADRAYDFAHGAQTNPTLFIQSAAQSATQWMSFAHNQTNAVITTGTGNLVLDVAGDTIQTSDNKDNLAFNIPVTGTDATSHLITLQLDGLGFLYSSATGDGAGAIGAITTVIGGAATTDILQSRQLIAFTAGRTVLATAYQIGRDADATNQLHFNIPTGASMEWSINDVAKLVLDANGGLTQTYLGTTTDAWTINATALTTGSGLVINGPSGATAGMTSALVKLATDIGNCGVATPTFGLLSSTVTVDTSAATTDTGVNLFLSTINSNATNANTTYGIYNKTTDAIALGNTNYGQYTSIANTGATGVGVTKTITGSYISASSTSATAGTTDVCGQYITTTATHAADAGTVWQYGLYVASGTSSTNGASTKFGIYVENQTGADANYAGLLYGLTRTERDGVLETPTDSIQLWNATAATVALDEFSPALRFHGSGWKTDATAAAQNVDWRIYEAAITGTSAPAGWLYFTYSVNDGAFATKFAIDNTGTIYCGGAGDGNARFVTAWPVAGNSLGLRGNVTDGATAVAVKIASINTLSTAGAQICGFYSDNVTTEVAYVNYLGSFNAGAGTALLPAYSFVGDPNTGMYWVSADLVGFSVGGVMAGKIGATSAYFNTFIANSATTVSLKGQIADGASAVGVVLDNVTALTTAGTKLVSVRNAASEKAYIDLNGGFITLGGMIQGRQGTDIASANNAAITITGNYFDVTGAVQINTLSTTGIQAGTVITLQFDGAPTVKHATAGTGAQFQLASASDFSATAGDTLTLVFDGTYWRETARTAI